MPRWLAGARPRAVGWERFNMRNHLRQITFKASLAACVHTDHDAREQFAAELRRIAEVIDEGITSAESGNMGCADFGSWEIEGLEDE